MTTPIAWEGNVEQYAGRLHRDYEGKKDVIIYDYIDIQVKVFDRMYAKRLRVYKRMGYSIFNKIPLFEQRAVLSSFYEGINFEVPLESDIMSASKEIVISSPVFGKKGVNWFLSLLQARGASACRIIVFTGATSAFFGRKEEAKRLLVMLQAAGICVQTFANQHENFIIIDRRIVWYGNAHFLSGRKERDNVLRMDNREAAADILSMMSARSESLTSPAGI